MTPAIYHVAGRFREATRSPRLLLTGLACGVAVAALDARLLTHVRDPTFVRLANLALLVFWVGGFASIVGSGATTSPGQGRSWSTRWVGADTLDWAHPPLPLGPKSRILAEAFAAIGLILLSRAILEPAYLLLPGGSWVGVSGFVRDRFIDACLIVPCSVAWLLPSRRRTVNAVRRLLIVSLVVAWSFVAPRLGTWSWGVMALVMTVGLLGLSQVGLRFTVPFRGQTHAGALVRRARTPESQLWRDSWLGPPTANLTLTVGLLVVLLADAILYGLPGLSGGRSFVSGLGAAPLMMMLSLPLGVSLLGRQGRRGGTPLFGGYFVSAWSALPVRREAVLRGVYAHGLIWGGGLSLWCLAVPDLGDPWMIGLAGLAASASVAGALVSVAAADKWRGVLSMSATMLALTAPALAMAFEAGSLGRVSYVPAAIVIAALAGAAGGLPPLVHLVARRATPA